MRKGNITKYRLNPKRPPNANWRTFDAMSEAERHQAAIHDRDCPPATEAQLARARRVPAVRANGRRRLRALGGVLLDTAAMGAFLYFWFLAGWGLNYQRQPLRTMLEFHDDRITADALRDLSVRDIKALNELFDAAHAQGWPELVDLPPVLHPLFAAVQR